MGEQVTKPKVLFVEGKDEVHFFSEQIKDVGLSDDIQVIDIRGRTNLRPRVEAALRAPGHEIIASVGVVRDADKDPAGAFQSVCDALEAIGLPRPEEPLQPAIDSDHRTVVMILPDAETPGMLEDVCLKSVADDPAMLCVDEYFRCLEEQLKNLPHHPSKARVRVFLASKELLEEAHFEHLQEHLPRLLPEMPSAPSTPSVHVFLASRYKPDLDLGIAAEAGYWPLDHKAFDQIRRFLKTL